MTNEWKSDDGYSGCKTKYFGDYAAVICPNEGDGWGYQVFDESNEDAIMHGEVEYEDYGFNSERAVMEFVENAMCCQF